MIHLNAALKQGPLQARIEELTEPQTYIATTVYGFYDARQEVRSTSLIKACMTGSFQVYKKTIIHFQNVHYKRIAEDTVQLEDISGELQVGILFPKMLDKIVQQQGISNGDRVQLASVIYEKVHNQGHLFNLDKFLNIKFPEVVPRSIYDLAPSLGILMLGHDNL